MICIQSRCLPCPPLPSPTPRGVFRYDSHRDQILRSGERHQTGGGGGFSPGERPEDEIDLMFYFTSACYSGFGDGPKVVGGGWRRWWWWLGLRGVGG